MSSYVAAANNYTHYEAAITRQLGQQSLTFLQIPEIVSIFGVDEVFGRKYEQQIAREFPAFVRRVQTEEALKKTLQAFNGLGAAFLFSSDVFGMPVSAYTMRYIYHALVIGGHLEARYAEQAVDVVEIGGGYGGLAFWLQRLYPSIASYTIYDLPAANQLQLRCLTHLGSFATCLSDSTQHTKNPERPLFVISNYGYSELNETYQALYKQTLLDHADGGFMIWNNWTGIRPFTNLPIRVEEERPVFEGCYNKFLFF